MLFYVIPAVLGFLLVVIRYSLWREKFSENLPGIKPGFFNIPGDLTRMSMCVISNNCPPVMEYFLQFLKERNEKFQQQQLFCIWGFYLPHICFVKAEAIKQLLSKEIGKNEKSWHYDVMKPLIGTGLLTSSMKKWKPRRKMLTPCFHADILREFLLVFNERSQDLVEHLRQETGKKFTFIGPPVTLTTLDIVYESLIGASVGALENNRSQYINTMRRLLDMYMSRNVKLWEWSDFIYDLTSGRKAKSLQKYVDDFIQSVIEEKKKHFVSGSKDNGKGKRKAFMDLLLEVHLETQELSEEDIREEVNTFVSAGYETVSHTIMWILYLIGLYPDVQDKIHEEMDRVFGSDVDRDVTESDLNDLKYLNCVIKETQRLYPAAPIIARNLKEDSKICNYTIPEGTSCLVLIYFLHRDKEVFPDPEKFDPDRFLPEHSVKIPEYAFMPFSSGPRNCIGQKFAVMEIKTIVSSILRNYTIESLDTRDKVFPLMKITLHPSIPIRMRIRARKNVNCSETARLK